MRSTQDLWYPWFVKLFREDSMLKRLFSLGAVLLNVACAEAEQLYVTMHTAPIDNYCTPCIVSEKRLKDANIDFRKILEPEGPWPWFKLTDEQGNQKVIRGTLTEQDVALIKKGEFPPNR